MDLNNIKTIFLDIGFTICFPLTGNWRFTKKFYDCIDIEKFNRISDKRKKYALELSDKYLFSNHCISTLKEEYEQNVIAYSIIADCLQELQLSIDDIRIVAKDRTLNMDNYVFYPNVIEVLKLLSDSFCISIISDAWPSSRLLLKETGIWEIIDTCTLSCDIGICKPNRAIYQKALEDSNAVPKESIFIDDYEPNLITAASFGIHPIKIMTVDKGESSFPTILHISDLLSIF